MRDCRRSRAPGCRLARVVSIVLLLQQQAGPFPPCSATESVPEGPLPYFFGSSSTYAAVRATIPNAQTCTVSNPSQNNDPAQERPQVCVPMTDSMLTLAEARAAAKRIRAFKTRGQTGSAANVDGSNRHSISNSSRLDSERLKLQDGVLPVPCNIPIISNLTDSFESFIDKFRHQPVIFSLQEWADAISQWKTRDVSFQGSPWKQFDWTESVLPLSQERQAESVGAKGQGTSTDKSKVAWEMQRVVRCLCNPIHGTLLHESTHISLQQELAPLFRNDGAELPATKYCLWGTSSLLNYLFGVAEGDGGSAPARHIVPEVNGELAKLLKFQCRVTPTCHGNIGVTALRHFSSRVLSLSWWPLAAALPASGIWLSSANTRTALHHDLCVDSLRPCQQALWNRSPLLLLTCVIWLQVHPISCPSSR